MKIIRGKTESGQTLIEPLLAIAIFGLILAPFIGALSNLVHSQVKYRHQAQAAQYAREGLEIAYNIAVNTNYWDDFKTQLGVFHPSDSDPPTLTNTPEPTEPIDGRFTRGITLEKARRNNNDNNITNETDDTTTWPDEDTLKVISTVTWEERGQTQEVEFTTYLINLGVTDETH